MQLRGISVAVTLGPVPICLYICAATYLGDLAYCGPDWVVAASAIRVMAGEHDLREAFDKLAVATRRSRSDLGARALRHYLTLQEWQIVEVAATDSG